MAGTITRVLDNCPDFDGWVTVEDFRPGEAIYASCNGTGTHPTKMWLLALGEPDDDGLAALCVETTPDGGPLFFETALTDAHHLRRIMIERRGGSTLWHYLKED